METTDRTDTALVDTMHNFAMFINQNWWMDMVTPDNVSMMNMQLNQRFKSNQFQSVSSDEPGFNDGFNVEHDFYGFKITVFVSGTTGAVRIRGLNKNRPDSKIKDMESGMKAPR